MVARLMQSVTMLPRVLQVQRPVSKTGGLYAHGDRYLRTVFFFKVRFTEFAELNPNGV